VLITDLPLCQLRLVNESRFPWCMLVPRKPDIAEVIDLTNSDYAQVWRESAIVTRMLREIHNPDKLNVAAIGNIVRQCHIHHVVRFQSDAAWPDPIWGKFTPIPYADGELQKRVTRYSAYLAQQGSAQQ
jgi:diadenosine tetraphosphate (Ap4A) HIT family hydrolase